MNERVNDVVEVGLLVTQAYFPLRALSERVLQPAGSSTARMAVLRSLATHAPLTVPELAQMRPVARQGVQRLANEMVRDGLLQWLPNPNHRRSRLLTLTDAGQARYIQLARLQLDWAQRLAQKLDPADLDAARQGLTALRVAFLEALEESRQA